MNLIKEANYEEDMKNIVLPFLKQRMESGFFERVKGQKIHYRIYTSDSPKADLVMVHGFTEGIDKFNEAVYYFLNEGFNVWQIQQRGHGISYREVSDPSLVSISDFHDLIEDLHYFVTGIVKKKNTGLPLYIYGHSMGGGVSAVYLETYPQDFEKAILSSPMLELDSGGLPLWAAVIYARLMILIGKGNSYMPGNKPFSTTPDFENSCSNCRIRFDYWFRQCCEKEEYRTCACAVITALQFLKLTRFATKAANCAKVRADVLLFQAGHDNMVKPGGQETFIRQIGSHGKLLRMDHAKHEIYLCTDSDQELYWDKVFSFFNN